MLTPILDLLGTSEYSNQLCYSPVIPLDKPLRLRMIGVSQSVLDAVGTQICLELSRSEISPSVSTQLGWESI